MENNNEMNKIIEATNEIVSNLESAINKAKEARESITVSYYPGLNEGEITDINEAIALLEGVIDIVSIGLNSNE